MKGKPVPSESFIDTNENWRLVIMNKLSFSIQIGFNHFIRDYHAEIVYAIINKK